ncbi:biotin--[acetyl-CoA-carboxylase] ligase [Balneolales bacterium ANBcel1]|nr:biotin--[acetyl-CoA-carboxylase] ligase [Balneolales bacterium ANBcel1]
MFDISSYIKWLQTGRLGRRFWYFRSLESTNRYVQDLAGYRLTDGLVCLTEHQTAGKGQFGRTWDHSDGQDLAFTLVLKPRSNIPIQLVTLTAMLVLSKTCESVTGCKAEIKWPNDLLITGKKVAGMLTECRFNGRNLDRVAMGLGINVNRTTFSGELNSKATSLRLQAGGGTIDRSLLLAAFFNRLEPYLSAALDGDRDLLRAINRNIRGYGQWVSVHVDGVREQTPVKVLGINEFGYLLVLTANDDVKTYTHQQVRFETGSSAE